MKTIDIMIKCIKQPKRILYYLEKMGLYKMDDKEYLKIQYELVFNKKLNLENPQTFNEKLQWLKLYDRNPEYTKMVDKYEVKQYVANIIGEEHIIPTLGVYEKFKDINFDELPNQFVLKCTHDSGGIVICKDKNKFNVKEARRKINKCLKRKFYYIGREWPYKNVKPRIIAEKYMIDESGTELKDYKIFCFNGVPKIMFIATDREKDTRFDFYDMEFNHLPIINGHPNANKIISKPTGFSEMKKLAQILSENLPHVRVDFYDINGKIYFGEFTFYHWGGMVPFEPYEYDEMLGNWIKLPKYNEE